jgi:hypothetical protein
MHCHWLAGGSVVNRCCIVRSFVRSFDGDLSSTDNTVRGKVSGVRK